MREPKKAQPKTYARDRFARPLPADSPQIVPRWHKADVHALQQIALGSATPAQAKRALDFIIMDLCGTYAETWFDGGIEAQRASDFAQGKRHIGRTIVNLCRLNLSEFKDEPQ